VVLFDLDLFKHVNDQHGHQVGDRVLVDFARILKANTRDMDLSARFGGEEFLTVLTGETGEGAERFAERVRASLEARRWEWGSVTVSAGVSEFEEGMASPDVLVAAADQALYRAKQAGRNRIVRVGKKGRSQDLTVSLSRPASHEGRAHGELILLVDDDPSVLRTLAMALRRKGYRVLESEHPLRALEIARGLEEPVDLVLADVVMPDMSGFRFVEILTRQQPRVRVLYISGYSRESVEWAGVPGAVKAFLPKPFTLDALVAAVRRTLDAKPEDAAGEVVAVAVGEDGGAAPAARRDPVPGTGEGLRARLTAQDAQLQEAYAEILLRLARAAEYRDDDTGRHAERVGILAGLLAEEAGLAPSAVARVTLAAPLHDIGKIAVPDAILKKPGKLTPAERAIMNGHCEAGAELLSGSSNAFVREAELIAGSHHERWDGGGYPRGLKGEEIPLSARITAVADAFDSITHMRPYRGKRPWAEAVEVIQTQSGLQFDPDVVDALLRLAERGRLEDEGFAAIFGASHVPAGEAAAGD
jgi:putative two-component system response regulator